MNKDDIPFHLYLGCRAAIIDDGLNNGIIVNVDNEEQKTIYIRPPFRDKWASPAKYVKLIVRRLESMTEEEWIELALIHVQGKGRIEIRRRNLADNNYYTGDAFLWLLSKGFWLFDESAFDEGLIIDAATIK